MASELKTDAKQRAWGAWDDVYAAIDEIEWFVTRAKDLGARIGTQDQTWGDVLALDIRDLRVAIKEARSREG